MPSSLGTVGNVVGAAVGGVSQAVTSVATTAETGVGHGGRTTQGFDRSWSAPSLGWLIDRTDKHLCVGDGSWSVI